MLTVIFSAPFHNLVLLLVYEAFKKVQKLKKIEENIKEKHRVLLKSSPLIKGAAFCIPQGLAPDDLPAGFTAPVAG